MLRSPLSILFSLFHRPQLLLAIPLAFAALSSHAAGNSIVIGQAIDLSGPNASIGRDYVAGIKTHFDAINTAGGINGKRIVYIVRDDRGQPEQAARSATELIEREQVDYLLGGVGDDSTQAVLDTPAFKRSGHILLAPLTGTDYPATHRVLFWRPSYRQELHHLFLHFSRLGIREIGIAYQDTPSNQHTYRNLVAAVQERGLKLTATARIGLDSEPLAGEASRLAATHPGFVLVIADTIGTALFLKAYRRVDSQTFVAGTSLVNLSTLRELTGPAAVKWTVFSQVVPDPGSATMLLQVEHLNMMKKYRDEAVSALTLEGYAAAKFLTQAIRLSRGDDRGALRELMNQRLSMDLGGLSAISGNGNRLSAYLDIALLTKKSGLKF